MIRILTDTTSDISLSQAAKMLVDIVPLSVTFGDKTYREAYEMSMDEFYARLVEASELPKTSQPPPTEFLPYFQAAKLVGDAVICILLSSKVSGTCQSAAIAKAAADYENIYIINSHSAVVGLRLLVEKAVEMRAEGIAAEEIVSELESLKKKIKFYAIADTLEYIFKGGRLSRTTMLAGTLLGVKPVLELKEGALEPVGKARGTEKAYEVVCVEMEKGPAIDYGYPVYFGYTMEPVKTDVLQRKVMSRFAFSKSLTFPVGSVIGAHAGPGVCIVVYVTK